MKSIVDLMQNDTLEVNEKLKVLKNIIAMKKAGAYLVPEITQFIERNNYPELLSFAIEALGEIGIASDPAIPIVGDILVRYKQFDSFDYIQNYAAESLGKIGSEQAVPFLTKALRDPSSQGPCLAAIYALSMLKNKAQSAMPLLEELRNHSGYSDYYPAIDKAMGKIAK